jgi:hypothetical protein
VVTEQFRPYQAVQKGDALVHQPLVASHWVNFCSEKQHKVPSSAEILSTPNKYPFIECNAVILLICKMNITKDYKENRASLLHTCKNTSLSLWYEKSVSRLT